MMKYLRIMNILAVGALILGLTVFPQPATAQAPVYDYDRSTPYVPGELVVYFTPGSSSSTYAAQATAMANEVGAMVESRSGNMALLKTSPDADILALAEGIAQSMGVQLAQPNYIHWIPETAGMVGGVVYEPEEFEFTREDGSSFALNRQQIVSLRMKKPGSRTATLPNYPKEFNSSSFWGWDQIQADIIWNNSTAAKYVCVLDTGVDYYHPDLKGYVVNGKDFVNNDSLPNDDNGHGTAIAGVISAKANNSSTSVLGVSNGKVLAVKVLGAQGWGTSYNIAQGIIYCANNSYVKVINISFGSYQPDTLEYLALYYAIQTKGKLVVAAAGNDSVSDPFFPAAWADQNVRWDYDEEDSRGYASDITRNAIYEGMISVGAATWQTAWVDENGDEENVDEYFENCATYFTNYGQWVEMVAPGESILTTTPYSYPFWMNMFEGVTASYDYFSGTSMAAAYVAGAAVRTLTVDSTLITGALLHTRLLDEDHSQVLIDLDPEYGLVVDTDDLMYTQNIFDPRDGTGLIDRDELLAQNSGYINLETMGPEFSEDLDFDGFNESTPRMPFCWPTDSGPLDTTDNINDMTNTRYLNVAKAMERGALMAEATDAHTSLPLVGATVSAGVFSSTGVFSVKKSAVVTKETGWVMLNNLPVPIDNSYEYGLSVSKSGYTYGTVIFDRFFGMNVGEINNDIYNMVSVPPYTTTNLTVVANWHVPDEAEYANLDLYLWLPENISEPGSINTGHLIEYLSTYPNGDEVAEPNYDFGMGNLIPIVMPVLTPVPGLPDLPISNPGNYAYAFHNRDGGRDPLDMGSGDSFPMESITIAGKVSSIKPYIVPWYSTAPYFVLMTDYSNLYPDGLIGPESDHIRPDEEGNAYPIIRVWAKGKLVNDGYRIADMILENGNTPCTEDANLYDWVKPFTILGTAYMPNEGADLCGTSEPSGTEPNIDFGILPYPLFSITP
jgi:subtilisin family serine protease